MYNQWVRLYYWITSIVSVVNDRIIYVWKERNSEREKEEIEEKNKEKTLFIVWKKKEIIITKENWLLGWLSFIAQQPFQVIEC